MSKIWPDSDAEELAALREENERLLDCYFLYEEPYGSALKVDVRRLTEANVALRAENKALRETLAEAKNVLSELGVGWSVVRLIEKVLGNPRPERAPEDYLRQQQEEQT